MQVEMANCPTQEHSQMVVQPVVSTLVGQTGSRVYVSQAVASALTGPKSCFVRVGLLGRLS